MNDYWSFGNKTEEKEVSTMKEVDLDDPSSVENMIQDLINDVEAHSGARLSDNEKQEIRNQVSGILEMLKDMDNE